MAAGIAGARHAEWWQSFAFSMVLLFGAGLAAAQLPEPALSRSGDSMLTIC
jgi:hypothetical protein